MKWLLLAFLLLLLLPAIADAACTGSSPTWTSTPDSASINTCITGATAGDTINVSAGTVTWTTPSAHVRTVVLNKGVSLIGATTCSGTPVTCTDSTIINDQTGTGATEDLIVITGTNARVSGFTFIDTRGSPGLLDSDAEIYMQCTNCRVDHNSFKRTNTTANRHIIPYGYNGADYTGTALIDNNYFEGGSSSVSPHGLAAGENAAGDGNGGTQSWTHANTLGTANAIYIEDNNFVNTVAANGATDCYFGARYVFRKNTVQSTNMSCHGFDSGPRSGMQMEFYRNTVTNPNAAIPAVFISRGGTHMLFENTVTGNWTILMTLYLYRSLEGCTVCGTKGTCGGPLAAPDDTNIRDQNTSGQQGYACRDQIGRGAATSPATEWPTDVATHGFSEILLPAYHWKNSFKGAQATIANIDLSSWNPSGNETRLTTYHLLQNRDFYIETALNSNHGDGTVGVGYGTLAQRPATCTAGTTSDSGVGYWATDQGSWNLSSDGLGSGVLYKCTSTNTWTASYTPYTYPHPLQGPPIIPLPDAPTGLRTIGATTGNSCTLTWAASGLSGLLGYHVYHGHTVTGSYDSMRIVTTASAAAAHTPPRQTTFQLLQSGTHYFSVTAYNADGDSAYATEVTCTSTGLSRTAATTRPGG